MDLYQQCAFLSYNCLGHASYYTFQARYAVLQERQLATHSFKQILGFRHLDELKEKLDKFSFRVTKEECLDLPEKLYVKREVDLTEEQVKAYNEMRLMALAQFSEGLVSTVNALTQIMRLHQIVCGHVKLDDGTVLHLPNNRIKELLNVTEESDGKMIIWANYRHDIEALKLALQEAYGMSAVGTYYGDTSGDERQRVVSEFQNPDSAMRFFVGNPSTGGMGLTLTAAHTMVYYSNSYDLAKRLQSEYPHIKVQVGSNDPDGHDLVVNATPMGMNEGDPLPMNVSRIAPETLVGEVVMRQEMTAFLTAAQNRGCKVQVGSDMLFEQIPAYLEYFGLKTTAPEVLRNVARLS
jgi:hypothetical protein